MPVRKNTSDREIGSASDDDDDETDEAEIEPQPVPKRAKRRVAQPIAAVSPAKGAGAAGDPERGPRLALSLGAALLMLGLALVGIGPSEVGRVVVLVALLTIIYGVHSFGRLGPPEGHPASGADEHP